MSNEKSNVRAELQAQRNSLYGQLVSLSVEDPRYADLSSRIEEITGRIFAQDVAAGIFPARKTEAELTATGQEYDKNLAVYVNKGDAEKNASILERLSSYKDKKPEDMSKEELAQKSADEAWRNKELRSPIGGSQWLSNVQVEAATGQDGSVGISGLNKLLDSKKDNLPVSFAHIITGPNDDNHFVSFDIRQGKGGKTEVTFVDSNGELMPPSERSAILRKFPGAEIKYLDKEGNKITENEAVRNPDEKLLRVQFDGHNCGLYTSHFVNMFNVTNGDDRLIKAGVEQIKEVSKQPKIFRQVITNKLHNIANNNGQEQEIHTASLHNLKDAISLRADAQDRKLPIFAVEDKQTGKSTSVAKSLEVGGRLDAILTPRKTADMQQIERSNCLSNAQKYFDHSPSADDKLRAESQQYQRSTVTGIS